MYFIGTRISEKETFSSRVSSRPQLYYPFFPFKAKTNFCCLSLSLSLSQDEIRKEEEETRQTKRKSNSKIYIISERGSVSKAVSKAPRFSLEQ
jgi:hypothetical protein